jgi:transglutaminase-like putative cysteine protease
MKRSHLAIAGIVLALLASGVGVASDAPARTRTFRFTYQATVTGLRPGTTARIWLPVPPTNGDQEVHLLRDELPAEGRFTREPEYGNRLLYVEAAANDAGKVPLSLTYQVRRDEVGEADGDRGDGDRFLRADALVPISGKPVTLLEGKELPRGQLEAGRFLYDLVDAHLRYSKEGTGWGRGDAAWACDSRYGNCSDFHSLFISLARSQKIPAKFEIGFALPEKHGRGDVTGYHCWAKFRPEGHGWVPVDISEANKNPALKGYYFGHLSPDRVAFSTGRDLTLVPKQDGPPVNFLVDPYVEVDGKPYPADRVERHCRYEDFDAK